MARNLNGRPEPEVIIAFGDGFSYSKGKLEEAYRDGFLDKPVKVAKPKDAATGVKKEDVDLIVHELEIPRAQAEKALAQNGGDIVKTLRILITPS